MVVPALVPVIQRTARFQHSRRTQRRGLFSITPAWKFVIGTDFPVEKDAAMKSSLGDFVTGVVDRAGRKMPDSFRSDSLVSWVDSVGQNVLQELNEWQPRRAAVIVMPKRLKRRRRGR
jgi:hypothetical protein